MKDRDDTPAMREIYANSEWVPPLDTDDRVIEELRGNLLKAYGVQGGMVTLYPAQVGALLRVFQLIDERDRPDGGGLDE